MEQQKDQQHNRQSNVSSETKIYLTPYSTLQTLEEDQRDKSIDPQKDNTIGVSNDDLHEIEADRMTGSDRAGTAARKNDWLVIDYWSSS